MTEFFRSPAGRWSIVAVMLLAAAFFIAASRPIVTIDQGDYPRTIGRALGEPIPPPGGGTPAHWQRAAGTPVPNVSSGTSSFLFVAAAVAQSAYRADFSLLQLGFAAKLVFALFLAAMTQAAGRRMGLGSGGRLALFLAALTVSFAAHNIAFLQSFYGEFAFVLGLPLLVAALALPSGRRREAALFAALLLCGGAKAQFFYLPLLVALVMAAERRFAGGRSGWRMVAVLLLAQAICVAPMLRNSYLGLNRHHSTYVGSYLVLDPAELDRLEVSAAERQCIGIDAWGNRLGLDPADYRATPAGTVACPHARPKSFGDTLKPYLQFPSAAWRMLSAGLPPHLTVRYFHVDPQWRYVVRLADGGGAATEALFALTRWRDRAVGPAVWSLLLLSPLLLLASARFRRQGLAPALVTLAALAASQVPVTLLGEGIRDLSKHLAGAQYAWDLLFVLVVFQLLALIAVRSAPPATGSA